MFLSNSKEGMKIEKKSPGQGPVFLENDFYKAELDGTTGLLKVSMSEGWLEM